MLRRMSGDLNNFTPQSPALAALIERGFVEQGSDFEAIDRAFAEGMVTFYTGYDPTADSLHVGHLITIMAMRLVQRFGHRPIVVVGGGTALVGDPSGKTETRKMLSPEQVAENSAAIKRQLGRFIHFDAKKANDAVMLDNTSWLGQLGYVEFLRDIGRHFTVNRMIAAKTYRDRLEQELPLSFLEFNYQLLQAYDFLHLYREHGCTMQLGGSDQWGNMVAGVELIRRVGVAGATSADVDRDTAYCLTYPLLTTSDGKKMGKTERGAVWLAPSRFSAFDYYQFWVNCDDRDTARLLRYFTDVELDEIERITTVEGAAIRDAKARLAYEATALLHGEEAAQRARDAAGQAFGGSDDWSALPCVEVPGAEIKLVDLVVHEQVAAFKSKREARQRIEDGAVRLDDAQEKDPYAIVRAESIGDQGLRLQAGKKKRYRVKLVP